ARESVVEEGVQDMAPPAVARQDINNSDGRFRVAEGHGPEARYSDAIFHIEVSKISPNPNQPRRNFDDNALWELAKSIREFGFLQPLVVTRREKETEGGVDVVYELISGERRLLAAKKLGLEYVPAIVRSVDLEREKLELSIIENVQREDLSPIERARAFQRLQEEFRMTQREIASKLGKSRETVANTVRLLDLPLYIQEALEKGQITESHGRFLLQIGDPAAQKKLFDDILAQKLTTRDVKTRVQSTKPKKEKRSAELPPELKMLEERLTTELGAPVKIEKRADTGRITITFYSDEELQNIVARFGGGELDGYND
ncbi:MAG: ParB/RepB/Spo0J family partition protein, partial [bacterium]